MIQFGESSDIQSRSGIGTQQLMCTNESWYWATEWESEHHYHKTHSWSSISLPRLFIVVKLFRDILRWMSCTLWWETTLILQDRVVPIRATTFAIVFESFLVIALGHYKTLQQPRHRGDSLTSLMHKNSEGWWERVGRVFRVHSFPDTTFWHGLVYLAPDLNPPHMPSSFTVHSAQTAVSRAKKRVFLSLSRTRRHLPRWTTKLHRPWCVQSWRNSEAPAESDNSEKKTLKKCRKEICRVCGVLVFFGICGSWFVCLGNFWFVFGFVSCFSLLLARLSSFTDWCTAHRQQFREQKK